jgi:hypothetical protein
MIEKTLLAHKRYVTNMKRVDRLMRLATSNEGQFKPTGFWTYDGISADLFRMIVVFLHSAIEDLVRTHLPDRFKSTFTFSVANDIFKSLQKAEYDPTPLEPLRNILNQLAKRRHKIVHQADLNENAEEVDKWKVADLWLLTQWSIAAATFLYLFLPIVTEPHELFSRRANRCRAALDRNVEFGKLLLRLPKQLKDASSRKDFVGAKALLDEVARKLSAISDVLIQMERNE